MATMTIRWARRVVTSALSVAVVFGLAALVPPHVAAAASTRHRNTKGPDVQQGHAAFGTCPASAVHMKVTLLNPVVRRGVAVQVVAAVHNVGGAPCRYSSSGPIVSHGPTPVSTMGPCGSMTLAVYRPAHHEIWPGSVAYSCPMLVSAALSPARTVAVTGQWAQELGPHSGLPPIPPTGKYQLVVDGHFRFTVRIT